MDKMMEFLNKYGGLIFGVLMGILAVERLFSLFVYFSFYNLIWLLIYGFFAFYNLSNYFRRK